MTKRIEAWAWAMDIGIRALAPLPATLTVMAVETLDAVKAALSSIHALTSGIHGYDRLAERATTVHEDARAALALLEGERP